MSHTRRFFSYVVIWCIGFTALLGLFHWELMHDLVDLRLAGLLQRDQVRMSDKVVVVDVPIKASEGQNTLAFRENVGLLLKSLVANKENLPDKIGLDIWFSSEQDYAASLPALEAGVRALSDVEPPVPVIGAVNLLRDGHYAGDYLRNHAVSVYGLMHGVGHNWFRTSWHQLDLWPFYEACNVADTGIRAMPVLLSGSHLCDSGRKLERRVPIGQPLVELESAQIFTFDPTCNSVSWRQYSENSDGACLTTAPVLRNKILIVGRLEDDRPFMSGPFRNRSGPEVVAWATSDLLMHGTPSLLNDGSLHFGLVMLTSLVALGAFVGLTRFVRVWRMSPWKIAVLAAGVAIVVPILAIAVARAMNHDFSQVLLPLLAMVLTLALATHYQTTRLSEDAIARSLLPDHGFTAFDIFVSYRHSHAEWVDGTLRPLLAGIRRIDGQALNVFFDSQDIHAGDNWATRLGQVIHESRLFLAVLTPDYFEPNARGRKICAWEMEQALQRYAESAIALVPVFHAGYHPEEHTPRTLPHLRPIQGPFTDTEDWASELTQCILNALDGSES